MEDRKSANTPETREAEKAFDELSSAMHRLEGSVLKLSDEYRRLSFQAPEAVHDTSRQKFKAVQRKKRRHK